MAATGVGVTDASDDVTLSPSPPQQRNRTRDDALPCTLVPAGLSNEIFVWCGVELMSADCAALAFPHNPLLWFWCRFGRNHERRGVSGREGR